MKVAELSDWFSRLLRLEDFDGADPSLNGLQVSNDGTDIRRVAFAVDASLETIERSVLGRADLLFVHHGLFWGKPLAITGSHYRRVKRLIESNLALYAAHLPLDAHPEVGNNIGIAHRLNLQNIQPFGKWRGSLLGFYGEFLETQSLDSVISLLFPNGKQALQLLPFGPERIKTVGIISGGASDDVSQAIALGLDLYITGTVEHEAYHVALENKISVIGGGHYQTETVGPRLVAERLGRELGLDTFFVDVPTGL